MGIPSDDVVLIQEPESAGDPSVITVSCPDKTGLGCDLCRVILLFGLNIVKGDMSTDGRWCYIVFWVVGRGERTTRWALLKNRLLEMCPVVSMPLVVDEVAVSVPQVYLLKFSCYDRMGLLHDMTQVLCELELTIRRVKVSTTPDGRVLDLFFITDNKSLSLLFSVQPTYITDFLNPYLWSFLGQEITIVKLTPEDSGIWNAITAC